MTRFFVLLALLPVLLSFAGSAVRAHESRPLYVEITEREAGAFALRWRTPASVSNVNLPEVTLPACEAVSPVGTARGPGGPVSQRLFRCPGDIRDAAVEIRYPAHNPSVSTLLRVNWASGETRSLLASPRESVIALPAKETAGGVAAEYFVLGIEHIWTGYDHLLFVACLLWIAGTLRRVLITITGFTVAHSLTLAAAALDILRVPVPPVEATVALSIVFLATELVRDRRTTLTWRYPITVSASFGLLHGFGFAAVLNEIGLPQTDIPVSLLAFNLGVEAGQVAFVLALVALFALGRKIVSFKAAEPLTGRAVLHRLQRPAGYAVGTLAAFWLIERVNGFWG